MKTFSHMEEWHKIQCSFSSLQHLIFDEYTYCELAAGVEESFYELSTFYRLLTPTEVANVEHALDLWSRKHIWEVVELAHTDVGYVAAHYERMDWLKWLDNYQYQAMEIERLDDWIRFLDDYSHFPYCHDLPGTTLTSGEYDFVKTLWEVSKIRKTSPNQIKAIHSGFVRELEQTISSFNRLEREVYERWTTLWPKTAIYHYD